MPRTSKAAGSVALVTGANRGIGLAFVAGAGRPRRAEGLRGRARPGELTDEFNGLPVARSSRSTSPTWPRCRPPRPPART